MTDDVEERVSVIVHDWADSEGGDLWPLIESFSQAIRDAVAEERESCVEIAKANHASSGSAVAMLIRARPKP